MAVVAGEMPGEGDVVDLPVIDIELCKRTAFTPFIAMQPVHAQQDGQTLAVVYQSTDGLVEFGFTLDFTVERLIFDWLKNLHGYDDGSAAAASHAAELNRFILEYVGNGELPIVDHETRILISRVEASIPVNSWADHEGLNSKIEEWNAKAAVRRVAEATDGATA